MYSINQDKADFNEKITERLDASISQVCEHYKLKRLTLADISIATGHSSNELAYQANREQGYEFKTLESVARYLGVSYEWLLHGTGNPYEKTLLEIHDVHSLLPFYEPKFDWERGIELVPTSLLFRREKDAGRMFVLVRYHGTFTAKIYCTRVNLDMNVGAGGLSILRSLYPVLQEASKNPRINSRIAKEDWFWNESCDTHPMYYVNQSSNSYWMDDFSSPSSEKEHWADMMLLKQYVLSDSKDDT